jgi:hypothetical protein
MAPPASIKAIRVGAAALACCCLLSTFWKVSQQPSPPGARTATRTAKTVEHRIATQSRAGEVQARPVEIRAGSPASRKGEAPLVPAGLRAQGWVQDGLGGAIAGATVTARNTPGGPVEAHALSDADGRFTLGVASRSVELCAEIEGYSLDCIQTAVPSDENTLRLLPASQIVGRVVMAESGAAVAGATVEATRLVGSQSLARSSPTNDQGVFSIAALPAGSYRLAATSTTARSREARVVVGIGETSDPVLLLAKPAVQVTGEVLVANAPCRSGRVRLSGHFFVDAEVAAEGSVVLSGVFPGQYAAVATCEGGLTASPTSIEIGDEPVHHVWNLDPLPREPHPVADTAVDSSLATLVAHVHVGGDVPPDLQVFADSRELPAERARREGARFVFDALPLGEYRVYAQDRLEEAARVQLTRAGEAVTVALQLVPAAHISGVVLDEHDAPVADAWVSRARTEASVAYDPAPVLTDLDGGFSLSGAKNVPYRLTVTSPAGDAVMDGVKSGGDIVVHVARPGSVTGSVWTRGHGLVPEFTVELAPKRGREQHEARGVDSRFFVPALQPGEYDLMLRSPLGDTTRTVVVAPGEEVALELNLGRTLE